MCFNMKSKMMTQLFNKSGLHPPGLHILEPWNEWRAYGKMMERFTYRLKQWIYVQIKTMRQ